MNSDYQEFRRRLHQQDMWEILGKWLRLGATGVGLVLTLASLFWPQTFQLSSCVFGTSIAMVYTAYSIFRMMEAGKDSTAAMLRFCNNVKQAA